MKKTGLSFKQLFYLSITAFGIQFATGLQMSNMTSLYKFLGAESRHLSFLWLAAPIAGLFIQPLVGQLSDSTVSRYGKRIPYLFIWGLITTLALFVMPLANAVWTAAILLWILECSLNGSTESLRTLTADLTTTSQKARAFAMQAVFAGIGSGIAATLPWLIHHFIRFDADKNLIHYIPQPIKLAFFVGSIVIIASILWTIFHIKEKLFNKKNLLFSLKGKANRNILNNIQLFFTEIINNAKNMPAVIKKFYTIQIFTWIGLFCFWLYLDLAISQHFFGLPPGVIVSNNHYYIRLLEKGTEWGGICYGTYQFVSVIFALALTFLSEKIPLKLIHGIALVMGGLGIIAIFFMHDPLFILLSMIGVGIMWGSIMSMPYAIISAELPPAKMGVYLGLFNITITIPQIMSGLILSTATVDLFHNHALYTLSLGGLFILIAGVVLLRQFYYEYFAELLLVRQND